MLYQGAWDEEVASQGGEASPEEAGFHLQLSAGKDLHNK